MFQKYVSLIFKLLANATRDKTFQTEKQRLLYEKGYLIGFLAALAMRDTDVIHQINKKLK